MYFSDIIGHKEIVRSLATAITEAKVGHAYLFIGPVGVGKKTLAKEFAGLALCREKTAGPDCLCPSCVRVRSNTHPDLITIEPVGNSIKIEQLRQLQHDLFFRPLMGERKVCYFPNAELLTEAAANSFLKTLEEPPPGVVFIFTAVRADLILPTIRSRCQLYQFFPVPYDEIAKALVQRGFDASEASRRAELSQGLPGRALESITETQPEQLLGFKEALSLGLIDLFKIGTDLEKKERRDILELFKKWELEARQELLQAPGSGWSRSVTNEFIIYLEKIRQVIGMIENNANLRLVMEDFFLTLKTVGKSS